MTNKDKFLKDCARGCIFSDYKEAIQHFLKSPITPTLTEDERVILKNIDTRFTHISRDYDDLFITVGKDTKDNECILMQQYNHLFGFIKNGEEYEIKELLGND
ncbi:MAG: hypothetical protein J6T10_24520 [Methanobrevibacter sp.]|nr:hypothetical protein [Methanobrevibacter sp.]